MATYHAGSSSRRGASILAAVLAAGCLAAVWAYGIPSLQLFQSAGTTTSLAVPHQSANPPAEPADLGGRLALEKQFELLQTGRVRLSERAGYTCTLVMREHVGGELQPEDHVEMTVRHAPFSVSLKWSDEGRHVVFVEGANDDQMLVSLGGWQRILGRIKIDPHGERAMSKARYPITEAGLLKLTERLIGYRERDLGLKSGVRCTMQDGSPIEGRDCWCFIVEYETREIEPTYRRSIIHIDKELSVPISVENYTWPDEDGSDEPLIERYVYRDLDFSRELSEADFTIQRPRRAG